MKTSIVYEKSKRFAVRIVKLSLFLREKRNETIMSKQVLKCGTSIGANIAEAEFAISEKDFLSKMYIAFKECGETVYWLDILYESGYLSNVQYDSMKKDCVEIKDILSSITKTTRERIESSEKID